MSFINIPNVSATLTPADVTNALGYIPVNKAGDVMTGPLSLSSDPTTALQAATKQYVDNVAQGLNVKTACDLATTSNITLSGEQVIDGTLTSASRVLVKDQLTQSENGIYTTDAGTWTRTTDFDSGSEAVSAYVFVQNGTLNASTGWVQTTAAPITIGVTSLIFTQFSSAGSYTADGLGIILSGSQFQLDLDGSTLSKSALGLKVNIGGITNTEVSLTAAIDYSKLNLTNSIVNADINSAAAITRSKLASSSANHVLINDGSGVMSSEAQLSISRGGTGSATQNFVDLTTNQSIAGDKTFTGTTTNKQEIINGVAGAGYVQFNSQSSAPSTPSGSFRMYADSSNRLSWIGTNGFTRTFDGTANTADRSYTLPDASGEVLINTSKQTITGAKILSPISLTDAATIATDASLGNLFTVTLGGNRTLGAPTNPTNGQKATWEFIQDGTGGRTLSFNAIFNFGTFPTLVLSGAPGKKDYMGAIYNSASSQWNIIAYSVGF